jgi:hypothetical protein
MHVLLVALLDGAKGELFLFWIKHSQSILFWDVFCEQIPLARVSSTASSYPSSSFFFFGDIEFERRRASNPLMPPFSCFFATISSKYG